MTTSKPKLELTWIGKENRPRLEPRILLEDPELSYCADRKVTEDDIFDNILIQGDNLLALKALEAEYGGKVKCIYIDPPYNTGSAFAEYDDGIEHSLWLSLMSDRFRCLYSLLSPDGSIWVHLDDNEMHYAKVLLDEVFGRQQFAACIVWKKSYAVRSHAEFFSTSHEYMLLYCKERSQFSPNKFRRTSQQEARYSNPDNDPRGAWQSVTMTISLMGGARGRQYAKTGESENIFMVKSPSGREFLPPPGRCWSRNPNGFAALEQDNRIYWGKAGSSAPRLKMFLAESKDEILPTTLWAEAVEFGLNQDGIREQQLLGFASPFPTPKPEQLLSRVLDLATNPGDLVLDSFLGSGTTAAVAHKMGRRWIGVELGDHAVTHCVPRLKKVIDGEDPGGITEAVGWKGGGGFRFYRLAPSLLEKDAWGNWVISEPYRNAPDAGARLAEAMCKLEGFRYAPSQTTFWQHGQSTEQDYIYVTTQTLNHEQLQALSDEVGEERSLLVCCSAFSANAQRFPNLTLKKIPAAVLSRCEWGRDDYSLNVKSVMSEAAEAPPEGKRNPGKARPAKKLNVQELPLFAVRGDK